MLFAIAGFRDLNVGVDVWDPWAGAAVIGEEFGITPLRGEPEDGE